MKGLYTLEIRREIKSVVMLDQETILVILSCGHQYKLDRTHFWHSRHPGSMNCEACVEIATGHHEPPHSGGHQE
jgi:hypothetical protein